MTFFKLIKKILFLLPPESAHNLVIFVLKNNLYPAFKVSSYKNLQVEVFGKIFTNPIGLAAGFDKNAVAISSLSSFGFGFIEVGTVTVNPQIGNNKPRIFRLTKDNSIINRLGFNNCGIEKFLQNIKKTKIKNNCLLGINIGKNKNTKNAIDDYLLLIEKTYGKSDYLTINISSPNTQGLRNLRNKENLEPFLQAIVNKKNDMFLKTGVNIPVILKIDPDIDKRQVKQTCNIIKNSGIDGIIISNTTISRNHNLQSSQAAERGGLSGKALFDLSNQILKIAAEEINGKIPIIACGGIFSAEDVKKKMQLGATLVQIYSAFIFEGFELVERIKKSLDCLNSTN